MTSSVTEGRGRDGCLDDLNRRVNSCCSASGERPNDPSALRCSSERDLPWGNSLSRNWPARACVSPSSGRRPSNSMYSCNAATAWSYRLRRRRSGAVWSNDSTTCGVRGASLGPACPSAAESSGAVQNSATMSQCAMPQSSGLKKMSQVERARAASLVRSIKYVNSATAVSHSDSTAKPCRRCR